MRQEKTFWIAAAVIAGIALASILSVGTMMSGMMGPGMMAGAYGRGMPFTPDGWAWPVMMGAGWLMTLAFWASIGLGLFLIMRAAVGRTAPGSPPDAMEILRRRYAAGEIDEATYEHQRQQLAA